MMNNNYKRQNPNWIYPVYITVSCAFTAGMNIVHTKYILGIALNPELFIIPTAAGIVFGYLTARIRSDYYKAAYLDEWKIFLSYIIFACFITSGLNVLHTEWVLDTALSGDLFIAPLLAGIFFGYLLAKIKTLNKHLLQLATTDMLTQLCNRMQFESYLSLEIEKVNRRGGTFSLIFFDMDNFKEINDGFGHQKGDEVLQSIANKINKTKRKYDLFARYGGDEFIILAPNTNIQTAQQQAELFNQVINSMDLPLLPTISCSFGVVEYCQKKHTSYQLITAVDKALYRAKNTGRNCVVTA